MNIKQPNSIEKKNYNVAIIALIVTIFFGILAFTGWTLKDILFTNTFKPSEDFVMIDTVTFVSANKNVITFSVNVQYDLNSTDKAQIVIHGNYMEPETWSSALGDSKLIIEKGAGSHIFEINILTPEWSDFSLKAYLHPFPLPLEEPWDPLIISEPVSVPIRDIYLQHLDDN